MVPTVASVGSVFDRAIVDTGRLPAFLLFVALLSTFAFIRTSTHMIRAQVSWWPGNVSVGGTHVHHLVWGILALLIFGYVGVVLEPGSPYQELVAVLFGIGAGLTLDEFALWLELKDVYWEEEGRKSIDAMIVAGCVSGIVLVGFSAWIEVADSVEAGIFALAGLAGAFGIGLALVNAAKEKFAWAVASLLFPPAGVAPALRLAKPRSPWARLFYRERKRARAGARYGGAGSARPPGPPGSGPAAPSAG